MPRTARASLQDRTKAVETSLKVHLTQRVRLLFLLELGSQNDEIPVFCLLSFSSENPTTLNSKPHDCTEYYPDISGPLGERLCYLPLV